MAFKFSDAPLTEDHTTTGIESRGISGREQESQAESKRVSEIDDFSAF